VALPFYFQRVLGHSAVQTGLLMTPWPLAVGITAPIAGKLADRYPAGLLGGAGLGVFALGLAALSMIQPGASDLQIVYGGWRSAASASASSSRRTTARWSPPRRCNRSGAAGGMLATARLLGQTAGAVGVALVLPPGRHARHHPGADDRRRRGRRRRPGSACCA